MLATGKIDTATHQDAINRPLGVVKRLPSLACSSLIFDAVQRELKPTTAQKT